MSRVLITGASGLVGSHLLRMLVDEPRVTSIIAPTRRPLRVPMHKVENPCDPQLSDVLTSSARRWISFFAVLAPRGARRAAKRRLFWLITRW